MIRDSAYDEPPILIDIDWFENIRAAWDEIGREQKIFVKAEFLRIDKKDLVVRAPVDDKHCMRHRVRCARVIGAGYRIKICARSDFAERIL